MKKKILALLLIAALAAGSLAACGKNETEANNNDNNHESTDSPSESTQQPEKTSIEYPVEIENELGTTVIESEPNAIAVFDVGMLDILDTLGLGDKVVAVTHGQAFPDYLAQYDSDMYVNLGGFKDWDEEALIDANPDLIFAGFRQNSSIESVQAIAPTLYFADGNSYIDTLKQRVNAITAMFGDEGEAENYLSEINDKISTIKSFTGESEVTFVIVTVENGTLSLGGSGNGTTLLVDTLGLVSLYEDTGMGGRGGKQGDEEEEEHSEGAGERGEGGPREEGGREDAGGGREDAAGGREDAAGGREDAAGGRGGEGEADSEQTAQVVAYLAEQNPDYVFVYDKDAAEREEGQPSAEDVIASAGLDDVTAYQNDHVICVDSAVWSSAAGGLQATILQLNTLIQLFGLD